MLEGFESRWGTAVERQVEALSAEVLKGPGPRRIAPPVQSQASSVEQDIGQSIIGVCCGMPPLTSVQHVHKEQDIFNAHTLQMVDTDVPSDAHVEPSRSATLAEALPYLLNVLKAGDGDGAILGSQPQEHGGRVGPHAICQL